MRFVIVLLYLLCLALPVKAQQVQVRSGEHADFSRLTLNLPERIGWTVEQTIEGVNVALDSEALSIDTSLIFDRIPRDRLSNARWNAARQRLELSFACDCTVSGFWFGEAMLVLDISEPEESSSVDLRPERRDLHFDISNPFPRASNVLTPFPDMAKAAAAEPKQERSSASDQAQLDEARDRLLQDVSRASALGLLQPRQIRSQTSNARQGRPVTAAAVDIAEQEMAAAADPPINLRVSSPIDLDHRESGVATLEKHKTGGCLPDAMLDVTQWGSDAPFARQIAPLRLQLAEEFDQMNEAAVRQLAKLYLFFGFGAEARQMLDQLSGDDTSIDVLLALSDIAEYGFASPGSPLAGQLECDALAAFWSAMSYREFPEGAIIDPDAILLGFNALPAHLRRHYGPALSDRILEAQRPDVAARLLRIMERGEDATSPALELAKARTELARGAAETATERLQKVVDSNVELSARALIEMIETRVRQRETLTPDIAALAAAFAFEKRNEAIAPALQAALMRALAASGDFDEASEVYAESAHLTDPEQLQRLRADLATYLARQADDMTFLRLVYAGAYDIADQHDPIVAAELASRMLALGFPEEANQLATSGPAASALIASDHRLLKAKIAIAIGQPRQALVELLDLDDEKAELLRARALELAGDHRAAKKLFTSIGAEEQARLAALRGGLRYTGIEEFPMESVLDPDTGPVASTPSESLKENERHHHALSRERALLDDASAARAALSNLLMTYPEP